MLSFFDLPAHVKSVIWQKARFQSAQNNLKNHLKRLVNGTTFIIIVNNILVLLR